MIEIDKLCVGYENKKVIDNLSLNIKSQVSKERRVKEK